MKNYLYLIMILLFAYGASAGVFSVTNNAPTDNTWSTSSTVVFNVSAKSNDSTTLTSMKLFGNWSGAMAQISTESNVANNTVQTFTVSNIPDTTTANYGWTVQVTDATNATNLSTQNFGVDTTDPSIVVLNYSDGEFTNYNLAQIWINVTDDNPNKCVVTTTFNATSNSTGTSTAQTAVNYVNITPVNPVASVNGSNLYADNNYTWSMSCNDSAGNTGTVASRTVIIDTTAPAPFVINQTPCSNYTTRNQTCNDLTPSIMHNQTVDIYFRNYTYNLYNSSFNVALFTGSESTVSDISYTFGEVTADTSYFMEVIAYDYAGNLYTTLTLQNYTYDSDSTCYNLSSGWSICTNLFNDVAASVILADTGATTIAWMNVTNQFKTYSSGGTDYTIPSGDAVFIYMGAAGTWERNTWNITAVGTTDTWYNTSNSNWYPIPNLNSTSDFNLSILDTAINNNNEVPQGQANFTNVTYFSYYDNTASSGAKYVPYVSNWSINDANLGGSQEVGFGEVVWGYVARADNGTWLANTTFNWGTIALS